MPQCLSEIANKLKAPIRHHDFGQPMQFDDIIKEKDNYPGCIGGVSTGWSESFWRICQPLLGWSHVFCVFDNLSMKSKLTSCQTKLGTESVRPDNMFLLFGQLICATMANDFSDILFQARPIESVLNSLNRFILTEVSSQTSIMYFSKEKNLWGTYGNT